MQNIRQNEISVFGLKLQDMHVTYTHIDTTKIYDTDYMPSNRKGLSPMYNFC